MKNRQVKMGAILSYLLIVLNTMYGLFLTPYIVGSIGEAEYGVYKSISSLTTSIMVLDLGLGGTVLRYIAKFRATNEDEKIPNFVAMSLIQALMMCGVIIIVAVVLYQTIESAYSATFSSEQIIKAQSLFWLLIVNVVMHVIENVVNGVITGFNRFDIGNGVKVLRLIMRVALIYLLLNFYKDSIVIVLVDIWVTFLFLIVESCYVKKCLKISIKLTHWERSLFIESGKYTMLMFLTSVAAQVNNNLDNVFIGAVNGPTYVAVYSFGLLIFGMFEQLSTAISGVMLPTVSALLEKKNGMHEVQNLIIRVGRVQFMLLGATFAGFVCVGKEFIALWLGHGYEDVYVITLILMGPALFELCVNVCLSILRARNMLEFRTFVLVATTALNAIVTYVAIKEWSYIGAAVGTAVSFIIGSLIIMNIYYIFKLKLPILKIYRCIVGRTWVCLMFASFALCMYKRVLNGTLLPLLCGCALFLIVFIAGMLMYGFNTEERRIFKVGGAK